MKKVVFAGLALTLLGGCYKNTMSTGAPAGEVHESQAKFFAWGLVGDNSYDLDALCPSGVSSIEESMEVTEALLTCVTCSLYTPIHVKVTCASGSAYLMESDPSTGLASVTPMEVSQ
ncbi:MAG: hypothetical protein VX899_19085 [Myxococcota bacterium]|nr:hypothetical protein [Myxococcota bacterium]